MAISSKKTLWEDIIPSDGGDRDDDHSSERLSDHEFSYHEYIGGVHGEVGRVGVPEPEAVEGSDILADPGSVRDSNIIYDVELAGNPESIPHVLPRRNEVEKPVHRSNRKNAGQHSNST